MYISIYPAIEGSRQKHLGLSSVILTFKIPFCLHGEMVPSPRGVENFPMADQPLSETTEIIIMHLYFFKAVPNEKEQMNLIG